MTHNAIFEAFKATLPKFADATVQWYPNGKNSIRAVVINRKQYVFTFMSDKDWCFETLDSHLKRMKKGVH